MPEAQSQPAVIAYTDGGCRGNPGLGAWAYVLINAASGQALARAGAENTTTNNRMELNAVLQALLALRKLGSSVLIRSDSKYTIDSCATWMPGWKAKGWKRKGGELKNVDLLKQLDAALDRYDVRFEWVKGHAGDTGNEFVDQLLNQSMDQAASTSGGGAIEQRLSWPPN